MSNNKHPPDRIWPRKLICFLSYSIRGLKITVNTSYKLFTGPVWIFSAGRELGVNHLFGWPVKYLFGSLIFQCAWLINDILDSRPDVIVVLC